MSFNGAAAVMNGAQAAPGSFDVQFGVAANYAALASGLGSVDL